jgi:hypothetical protein
MTADALLAVFATEVAVTVHVPDVAGEVKVVGVPDAVEVGDTVPHVVAHVTPRFAPSLVTVAVIDCGLFRPILAVVGETLTLITGDATTAIDATAVLVGLAVLSAVSVTAELAEDGAVYVTEPPDAT